MKTTKINKKIMNKTKKIKKMKLKKNKSLKKFKKQINLKVIQIQARYQRSKKKENQDQIVKRRETISSISEISFSHNKTKKQNFKLHIDFLTKTMYKLSSILLQKFRID